MGAPLSSHLPGIAGATESFTDSLIVDTKLLRLQSFTATLKAASVTANEESIVHWELEPLVSGATQKIKLFVVKGGTAHGTVGDTPVDVSWIAIGE